MKVAVIGGGSTYTPELIKGFLERRESLPLRELWLMDIDRQRLEVVGGFAQSLVAAKGAPFKVLLTTDQRQSIQGASYVITQLRVGMMRARRQDEYLGRRHKLIGQETTGVGGMAKALRTIPVILELAEQMRQSAPDALLVNFTNPAGLITEALQRYAPDVSSVGVCNVAIKAKMDILEMLGGDPARAELDTLGLNHLSWHRGFRLDGRDVWDQVLEKTIADLKADPQPEWDPVLIRELGMIPNYYLEYYYDTARKIASQADWPPSRADEVIQVEKRLLAQYADPTLIDHPDDLMKRGGAYYSTVATQLLNAHYNDLGERHIVNTRHNGAVPDWPEEWVLEMPCRVDRKGFRPIATQPLPTVCFDLLAAVKSYELLTVEAAVNGDRSAAYKALLAHPLGPPAHQVEVVLEDMLNTHRAHLPQFFQSRKGATG